MAEEEGQARVALYDAGEADLLAGLAVVVADNRDGKATGVGWPRRVDKDTAGLAAPADEAQAIIPPEHNRRETSRNASPRDTASIVPAARALRLFGPPAPGRARPSPGRRRTSPLPAPVDPACPVHHAAEVDQIPPRDSGPFPHGSDDHRVLVATPRRRG